MEATNRVFLILIDFDHTHKNSRNMLTTRVLMTLDGVMFSMLTLRRLGMHENDEIRRYFKFLTLQHVAPKNTMKSELARRVQGPETTGALRRFLAEFLPSVSDEEFATSVGVSRASIRAFIELCERSHLADRALRGNKLTPEAIADAKEYHDFVERGFGGDDDESDVPLDDYGSLTAEQLRSRLRDLGLRVGGKKADLLARLIQADDDEVKLANAAEAREAVHNGEVEDDDDVHDQVDWGNMGTDELKRLFVELRVKGRFTRRRAIDSLQALYDLGEGCVCEELADGEKCHCGWIVGLASNHEEEEPDSEQGEDEADVDEEPQLEYSETENDAIMKGQLGLQQQQQQEQQQQQQHGTKQQKRRQRNFRWFTLETAESIKMNYEYLRDLMELAKKEGWNVELIKLIDQSTLELERYFGRVREGVKGTPTVQQFMRADENVRQDGYLRRLPIEQRWNLGASRRGNVEGMHGSGSDGRDVRHGAGHFLLLR
jgi:hypothetical protein